MSGNITLNLDYQEAMDLWRAVNDRIERMEQDLERGLWQGADKEKARADLERYRLLLKRLERGPGNAE